MKSGNENISQMNISEWITQIESDYNFAKEKDFDSIRIVIETTGGDYEIYKIENGLGSDTLDYIYDNISDIAVDLFNAIGLNGDKILDTRIE